MFVCIVCVYVYINIYIYKYALRSTAWQLTKFRAQEETKKIINKLITIGEKETPFALKNSSVFSVVVVVVAVVVVLLLLSRTENSCILTTTKSVGVTSLLLSCTLIEMRKRRKQTKEKKLNLSLNFKIFGLTYLYIIIK